MKVKPLIIDWKHDAIFEQEGDRVHLFNTNSAKVARANPKQH
jgi:hypothetical protein